MPRALSRAFTIVELLVVVTILVVLMALILPAMGKAVYQATLVKCAANLKAIASGEFTYAAANRRDYPYRGLPAKVNKFPIGLQVLTHSLEGEKGPGTYDARRTLRSFVRINAQLNDPLTEPVNLEYGIDDPVNTDNYILGTYQLWHAWQYTGEDDGMFKVGDRVSYKGHAFSILISDMDLRWNNGGPVFTSSHPDYRTMFDNVYDHVPNPFTAGFMTGSPWEYYTGSMPGPGRRDSLDLNFAYDDGSVSRLARSPAQDDRTARIPGVNDPTKGDWWVHVPTQ